jgi:hypothetical protein
MGIALIPPFPLGLADGLEEAFPLSAYHPHEFRHWEEGLSASPLRSALIAETTVHHLFASPSLS